MSSSVVSSESTPGAAPNICHTCTEPITTPQFIRVGVYKFHKDHFTCSLCSTSLHEKKFHHKDSKFYCADDYVNKFCHTCRHCKQKIATGSVIQAFGGYYHPDHFVCAHCSKPFKNGKYYEANDEPYCDEHYFLLTAEKCQTCGEGVKESDMVRVQGKVFHSHCLSCCHCGLPLAKKGSIFQKDGKTYCIAEDHQIMTNKGFMFLNQVRDDMHNTDEPLLFASYNDSTRQLQYLPASRLIDNLPDPHQSMIEFGSRTSSVSLLVTDDHDMYVRVGSDSKFPRHAEKRLAKRLLTQDASAQIAFIAAAAEGVDTDNKATPHTFMAELTNAHINAFLTLYGAWTSLSTPTLLPITVSLPATPATLHAIATLGLEYTSHSGLLTLCDSLWSDRFHSFASESLWSLTRDHIRTIISAADIDGACQIRTTDVDQRDRIVRMCIHAGYAVHFEHAEERVGGATIDSWTISFASTDDSHAVASALTSLASPVLSSSTDIRLASKGSYTGSTWCVTVPTGLILVRRALELSSGGVVTRASQPVIVGNCRNDYLNFFCKRCTACADHILKHCLAEGQLVNTNLGFSLPIEEIDADHPVLGYDGTGLSAATHDGAIMQPNERECITLTLADGRQVTCTPDHQMLTSTGYVPAQHLQVDASRLIVGVRMPQLTHPSKASSEWLLEHAFSLAGVLGESMHLRDPLLRSRTLALVRLVGYMAPYPTDSAVVFTHLLDSIAFERDVRTAMDDQSPYTHSMQLLLPNELKHALTQLLTDPPTVASTLTLPSFLLSPSCPQSVLRAFLSGLLSRSGSIGISASKFTLTYPTEIESLLTRAAVDAIDLTSFERAIAFVYSASEQERLAVASSHAGFESHSNTAIEPNEFIRTSNASDLFDSCHLAASSARLDAKVASFGTFELSLASSTPAGFRTVYDIINSTHQSFQVEGAATHNCITVNDEFYHPECIKCSHCSKRLDKYISISGYLRCNEHTELPVDPLYCSICSKLVEGEVVLSVGKKLHPECFKCATCATPLQKSTAKLKDDKLCCNECMMKRDPNLMAKNAAAAKDNAGVALDGETPIQVGGASASSSSSQKSVGAPVESPKPGDHDEFTKYERPQRARKTSKAIPQGKIEWKKGELIGKGSFGKVYMAMNCFPVEDHQLLTSGGFMDHRTFTERVKAGGSVEVVCPRLDGSMEVHPIGLAGLVQHTGMHTHVAIASQKTKVDGESCGVCIDLAPTSNHNMLVRLSGRDSWSIMSAGSLLDARADAQFRTNCAAGIVKPIEADTTLPQFEAMQLNTRDQQAAFLELYGYSIGRAAIMRHTQSIRFATSQPRDCSYLAGLFARLHLNPVLVHSGLHPSYSLSNPLWYRHFPVDSSELASWVTHQLDARDMKLVLRGMRTRGDMNAGQIRASSAAMRDSIMQLALMAGYSAHFRPVKAESSWIVDYTTAASVSTPTLRSSADMRSYRRFGTVWCVNVPTADHLVIFRRVTKQVNGDVTAASRPVVVGNSATGELIAVKQVRLNTAEEQEQAAAIQNEIGLMENLRHPNIVSLLGTQRNGNKLNILMEYVPGKSLDSLLEKFGGFSEKVIRSYTKQLLEALAYCHANRVVHRDIKGKNILCNSNGVIKLADFGSAKRFTNVMSKDAPSLSYNYTPLWTAPEVLTGDYNSKVDIWSLGCLDPAMEVWLADGTSVRADQLTPDSMLIGDDGQPVAILPNTLSGTTSPAFNLPQPVAAGNYQTPGAPAGTMTPCPGHLPMRRVAAVDGMFDELVCSANHMLTVVNNQKARIGSSVIPTDESASGLTDMEVRDIEQLPAGWQCEMKIVKYSQPIVFQSNNFVRNAVDLAMHDSGLPTGTMHGVDYASHPGGALMFRAAQLAFAMIHTDLDDENVALRKILEPAHSGAIYPPSAAELIAAGDNAIELMAQYIVEVSAWIIGLWESNGDATHGLTIYHSLQTQVGDVNDHSDVFQRCRHWIDLLGLPATHFNVAPTVIGADATSLPRSEIRFHDPAAPPPAPVNSILLHLLTRCGLFVAGATSDANKVRMCIAGSVQRRGFQQATVNTRMALLAGLIDADGWRNAIGDHYGFCSHLKEVIDFACVLFRQTGFAASQPVLGDNKVWQLQTVTAHYDHQRRLPIAMSQKRTVNVGTRKENPFLSGFRIHPHMAAAPQPVVCFQVANASQRFLLADNSITHNCVIIEMSSAKPPWSEQNFENPFRALYHIGNSDAIPKIPESLSEVGVAFVKQCLRRNPDERPDAATLLKQEWLSGIESLPNQSDDSGSEGDDQGASDSD